MAASGSQKRQLILKPGPNALVFLICTLLAGVFWLVKAMEEQYTTTISFPIQYQSFPDNKLLKDSLPGSATLKVRSSGWQLLKLKWEKAPNPLVVNLSQGGDSHLIQLEERAFFRAGEVPKKLKVLDIAPDSVKIAFDQALEKKVPVVLNGNFDFAKHHELADSIAKVPKTVRIKGPKTYVKQIESVSTKPFHFKEIKKKRVESAKLKAPGYPFVSYSHKKVKVIIPAENVTEKTIALPVKFRNPYYKTRITLIPSHVQAKFQVPLSRYPKIKAEDFKAVVNSQVMEQPDPPSYLPVKITKKPPFIYHFRYQPRKVRYLIPGNPPE